MVGMPLMLLIFFNFKSAKKYRVIEMNNPSAKNMLVGLNETINYENPKGTFYLMGLDKGYIQNSLTKVTLHAILTSKNENPKSDTVHDGLQVFLSNQSNYADYIFLINNMLIHGIHVYFFSGDIFYCYFNDRYKKIYAPNVMEKEQIVSLPNNFQSWSCGYKPYKPKTSLQENLMNTLQPHFQYGYFWVLYLLALFFSIKKLKKHLRESKI